MGNMTKPSSDDQGPAFPNPLSTNHIVRVLYIRAQRHPWVVKNRVPTITFIFNYNETLASQSVKLILTLNMLRCLC